MNPLPTDVRILDALQLQPMTVEQLSKCLSLYHETVRRRVLDMRQERQVRAIHLTPSGHGRPRAVYSIGPFRQSQKAKP